MTSSKPYLKGQLLVDSGKLYGTFFHRTVILICQHDAEGAFGLVLNRSSGQRVGEALVANLPDDLRSLPLFHGGPVEEQAVYFLHSDAFLSEANVMANLSLSNSLDALMELGGSFSPTLKLKVFAGYAGWSPGQLEDEMRRQTWTTHPASLGHVYHPEPDQLWRLVMREKGGIYQLLADAPENLSWN